MGGNVGEGHLVEVETSVIVEIEEKDDGEEEEPVQTPIQTDKKGMIHIVPNELSQDNSNDDGWKGILGSMEIAWKA